MTQYNLKIVNNQNGNDEKFHFYSELENLFKVISDTRLREVRPDAQRKYTAVSIHEKKSIQYLCDSIMNSQLLRCSTARGSSSGYTLEVQLRLRLVSIFFNGGSLKVENKEHLFDFIVTIFLPYRI